jgi:hypothetical protein
MAGEPTHEDLILALAYDLFQIGLLPEASLTARPTSSSILPW